MKVHSIFHIGLLKLFTSSPNGSEILPYDILSSNDFIYGDDTFSAHSVVDHKVAPHPQTYAKCLALLFKVKWEGYDSTEDSWEPYINVKRTDCFDNYK